MSAEQLAQVFLLLAIRYSGLGDPELHRNMLRPLSEEERESNSSVLLIQTCQKSIAAHEEGVDESLRRLERWHLGGPTDSCPDRARPESLGAKLNNLVESFSCRPPSGTALGHRRALWVEATDLSPATTEPQLDFPEEAELYEQRCIQSFPNVGIGSLKLISDGHLKGLNWACSLVDPLEIPDHQIQKRLLVLKRPGGDDVPNNNGVASSNLGFFHTIDYNPSSYISWL